MKPGRRSPASSSTCPALSKTPILVDPSGRPRQPGTNQLVYRGCFNPTFGDTTFDQIGAWGFAITGPEAGSISPAAINDVAIFVEMPGCSLNIAGAVGGDFDDATGVFTPTGSTPTIADDPAGLLCPLVGFAQGDGISVSGSWLVTGLTISNP